MSEEEELSCDTARFAPADWTEQKARDGKVPDYRFGTVTKVDFLKKPFEINFRIKIKRQC